MCPQIVKLPSEQMDRTERQKRRDNIKPLAFVESGMRQINLRSVSPPDLSVSSWI